jgi:hypothetical protein
LAKFIDVKDSVGRSTTMSGWAIPRELLLLACVGLAGFALGWWLRRDRGVERIPEPASDGPTSIVPSAQADGDETPSAEPVAREAAATLQVASMAIQQRSNLPKCPTCGSGMELRIFKEKRIWVCEEFPVCRGAQMAE